ncbi:Nif3-like dinuclear metal center hexameric protein [Alkalihalobacillus trypoxylicola]|uniref:GTP cyclohydrolase 1 type 2 homolog n=1 Tax=Alkalihalobacillus trypoxylicola TaxID=519424 RepID=A0A162E8Q8_9BACI|nr:Nif3-like dinuclear metal center hexameric protein [Alkalihalobacillus trypoxylicola]KYG32052.1 Nif3-like dinuclear metal center hexameric protein [Alkalihalobacillus trypoxylicola]
MSQYVHAQQLVQHFEGWAPKSLAVEGDKNGLMLGTLNKRIKKIMVTLDVLEEVIDEAIEEKVDFIFAHHPLLFRPVKQINLEKAQGRIIAKALKNDITIYAAHTNLDIANGGVNDMMAKALGLKNTQILAPTSTEKLVKVVVFVPKSHQVEVREALSKAGAGHIGAYSHCTFNSEGIGTFKPLEGTNPYIGEKNVLEEVEEVKIETIIPEAKKSRVIRAIVASHPYEEPAFDIYPLENEGNTYGLGRIGEISQEMSLKDFAYLVKEAFHVDGARVVGDLNKTIKKVAVLGGDGNKYLATALHKGADVIVTGDVYYHMAHDVMMEGLSIIDPGHHVEKIMKVGMSDFFQKMIADHHFQTEVIISKVNTDPFQFV